MYCVFLIHACSMTYPHLPSVRLVITLSKGKTTCPLLLLLQQSVRVQQFRVYWTPLCSQTEQLLSGKS